MASQYDIIIIGGGPAGLSAAASIVRQDHKTVLFDSGKYRNAESEHMHTVPAWDHRDPAEFRAASLRDLERYWTVTVEKVEVETVKKNEDGVFEATAGGKTYTGKKLILATGALRLAKQVTLYTNGNEELARQLTDALTEAPAPMTINSKTIKKLVKGPDRSQIELQLDDGTSNLEAFLAHKPKTQLRGSLAQQLGLELAPKGTIKVDPPFNQTTLKGVFAAGDCSSPMQTVTAAFHSGTCTGGGALLQIQAEALNQKALF
ncbi:hypothetical protein Daus18300_013442 [Diaporthe australafricana]|uniref:FAD/NAD(P)-binding domain-containing protein n=1 Tax=Diaporthe australafricana TaxID=127596 RepID=A0ABR3VZ30_9PEZI